ncbi:MAG: hypothetical protein EZS28_010589, partial [Streblomastix strix]
MNEIEGIPMDQQDIHWDTEPDVVKKKQRPLECYWNIPYNGMYHVYYRKDGHLIIQENVWCAEYDEPCKTIEYAIKRASFRKGVSETAFVIEKKI